MLVFKMNLREKETNKKKNENKKLNMLWPLSLTQLLRTKSNKLDFKMKKCSSTLRISWESKSKTMKEKPESKKSKRNRWENTWQNRLRKKNTKKCKRKRLTRNRPKFGKRTLKTFSKMRRISPNTWKTSTSNTRKSWRNKWKIKKIRRTKRKWTLWSFFITRPWWKLLPAKMKTLKKQKSELKDCLIMKLYFLIDHALLKIEIFFFVCAELQDEN